MKNSSFYSSVREEAFSPLKMTPNISISHINSTIKQNNLKNLALSCKIDQDFFAMFLSYGEKI